MRMGFYGPSRWACILLPLLLGAALISPCASTGQTPSSPLRKPGLVWERTSGPTGGDIWEITITAEGTLLAGTMGAGLFRSVDRGQTWRHVESGLGQPDVMAIIQVDSILYAGTLGGIFRSVDDGKTWESISTGLTDVSISSLAALGNTLFAGTYGSGVFRSVDQGQTWSPASAGLVRLKVETLAVLGDLLFAGTDGGLFRSDDRGDTWCLVGEGWEELENNEGEIEKCLSLLSQGSTIFVGTGDGVVRSYDGGATWEGSGLNSGFDLPYNLFEDVMGGPTLWQRCPTVFALATSGPTVYAGTGLGGVYYTEDGGQSWAMVRGKAGKAGSDIIYSLAVSGDTLYAGTDGEGIFVSTAQETNWKPINNGLTASQVRSLGAAGSSLFAGVDKYSNWISEEQIGTLYRSDDQGQTWTPVNNFPQKIVRAFVASGTEMFAGTWDGGVFRSPDKGVSWEQVNSGLTRLSVLSMAVMGESVYAGTRGGGVCRLGNGEDTWVEANEGLTNPFILSLSVVDSTLYAGTGGGMFRSVNGGKSWTGINNGLRPDEEGSYSPYAFAARDMTLYVGLKGIGVFRSQDRGGTWSEISAGLPADNSVQWLETLGSDLYTGTWGEGVFRWDDGNRTWKPANAGLANRFVRSAVVADSTLYIGTSGGVFRSALK